MNQINYFAPESLKEAFDILNHFSSSAKIIAGGTDIIPGFQQKSSRFKDVFVLIDLKNLHELKKISIENNFLHIGASVTFTELQNNELILKHFPLLAKAASTVGSLQIRNRATMAGNFVNCAPCADSVAPLLVYDAEVIVKSAKAIRQINMGEFLIKPYKTQLKENEIVTEVLLPLLNEDYKGDFYKLGRRSAVSISRISLAVLLRQEKNILTDFRIASGAVTPIGKRFPSIENLFIGKEISQSLLKNISVELGKETINAAGIRWSAQYKIPVVQQVCYQLLNNLCY